MRSDHWPSDLDVPTTSWGAPLPDPCFPVSFCGLCASRSSLSGGAFVYTPRFHYPYTVSDPSLPTSCPICGRYHNPFGPTKSPPTLQPSPPLSLVPVSPPTLSPSQTESVVGSMRRTSLSPITERTSQSSAVPPPPAFGRTPVNGPLPSTSSTETFSTPSLVVLNPQGVPPSKFSVSTAPRSESVAPSQVRPNWFDMIYPLYSHSVSSADEYTIPSPTSVEVHNLRLADNVRWSSLFPSAPIVVERTPPEDGILLRSSTPEESVLSPMSSLARSVISYATSTFL